VRLDIHHTSLRTNGMGVKMIQQNPFMLSLWKHVPLFFNNLLTLNLEP
jgi:hypothetical protein